VTEDFEELESLAEELEMRCEAGAYTRPLFGSM
jgi:hypothetical protein